MKKLNMNSKKVIASALLAGISSQAFATVAVVHAERVVGGASIKFVVPKGENYADKIDFAALDNDPAYKIPEAALAALTPEMLNDWSQEELDQLYARLPSGPIPNGAFKGSVILAPGGGMKRMVDVISNEGTSTFIKDHKITDKVAQKLGMKPVRGDEDAVRVFAEAFWHGKIFYRDQKVLRNLLAPWKTRLLTWLALGSLGGIKAGPSTGPDKSIPKGEFGHEEYRVFPAKLYCGQSILDARRESVIIDYAYTDQIEGFNEAPKLNVIAGRKGLAVRDEIRMVRPGFYLGRAYAQKAFLLNFTLLNPTYTKAESDCWPAKDAKL